jgi:hypothetical protein
MKTTDPCSERRAAMTSDPSTSWAEAPLVAVDLEGIGAQDRDDEAIGPSPRSVDTLSA